MWMKRLLPPLAFMGIGLLFLITGLSKTGAGVATQGGRHRGIPVEPWQDIVAGVVVLMCGALMMLLRRRG
jgi:hypothetical protein